MSIFTQALNEELNKVMTGPSVITAIQQHSWDQQKYNDLSAHTQGVAIKLSNLIGNNMAEFHQRSVQAGHTQIYSQPAFEQQLAKDCAFGIVWTALGEHGIYPPHQQVNPALHQSLYSFNTFWKPNALLMKAEQEQRGQQWQQPQPQYTQYGQPAPQYGTPRYAQPAAQQPAYPGMLPNGHMSPPPITGVGNAFVTAASQAPAQSTIIPRNNMMDVLKRIPEPQPKPAVQQNNAKPKPQVFLRKAFIVDEYECPISTARATNREDNANLTKERDFALSHESLLKEALENPEIALALEQEDGLRVLVEEIVTVVGEAARKSVGIKPKQLSAAAETISMLSEVEKDEVPIITYISDSTIVAIDNSDFNELEEAHAHILDDDAGLEDIIKSFRAVEDKRLKGHFGSVINTTLQKALFYRWGIDEGNFPVLDKPREVLDYLKALGNEVFEDISNVVSYSMLDMLSATREFVGDNKAILTTAVPTLIVNVGLKYSFSAKALAPCTGNSDINDLLAEAFAQVNENQLFINVLDVNGTKYRAWRVGKPQIIAGNQYIVESVM